MSRWYNEAAVVERGPLVYALRMNEKWERHAMEPEKQTLYGPYYYEVTSDSPWNYCLPKANVRPEKVAESFVVEDAGEMAPYPWTPDGSPVKIRTQAHRIGDWTLHGGSAGPIAFVSSQQMYMTPEAEWIELNSLRLYDPACYGVPGAIDERCRIRNAADRSGGVFPGRADIAPGRSSDSAFSPSGPSLRGPVPPPAGPARWRSRALR